VLWYLLVGTRGGVNRARIIRTIADRPRNANKLADHLDLDYSGSEVKAHPFRGGMKPTTGNLSTLIATVGGWMSV
jgi:hypothetical protein